MAQRIWLKFEDGSESTVNATPRSLIAAEEKYGNFETAPRIQATFYAAYIAARVTGVSFADWVNSITDFKELEAEDPTMGGKEAAFSQPPRE